MSQFVAAVFGVFFPGAIFHFSPLAKKFSAFHSIVRQEVRVVCVCARLEVGINRVCLHFACPSFLSRHCLALRLSPIKTYQFTIVIIIAIDRLCHRILAHNALMRFSKCLAASSGLDLVDSSSTAQHSDESREKARTVSVRVATRVSREIQAARAGMGKSGTP
jgi:hypothetical protein